MSEWEQVLSELNRFGISPKVDIWLSTEWFCPDGVAELLFHFIYITNHSKTN